MILLATKVGSGIMAEGLASGNAAVMLLANAIATGAILVCLILIVRPISGCHLNPVVTIVDAIVGAIVPGDVPLYILAQCIGAVGGVFVTHLMFGLSLVSWSTHACNGPGQLLSEALATFGLMAVIVGCSRAAASSDPYAVGLYITAAYWFTSSTSFANPAVTLARSLTNTFSGIRSRDVPSFIAAQFVGAAVAMVLFS